MSPCPTSSGVFGEYGRQRAQTIEPPITWLLLQAYRCRLRAIVGVVQAWIAEGVLRFSERIGDERAVYG